MLDVRHTVRTLLGLLLVLPLATATLAHPATTSLDPGDLGGGVPLPVGSDAPAFAVPAPSPSAVGPAASIGATSPDPLRWLGVETMDTSRHRTAPPPERLPGDDGPGGTDDLTFVCPDPPHGLPVQPTTATSDMVIYTCPYLIRDGTYSLGNGAIALDHDNHNDVAFTSLHGGAGDGEPYSHARGRVQVHTTFTSASQGVEWWDQPPSPRYEPSREARGTDNDIAMDENGNVYGAYLYHEPVDDDRFASVVHVFKAGPVSGSNVQSAYPHQTTLPTRDAGNLIERIHLLHVPPTVPVTPSAEPANETAPSADDDEIGQAASTSETVTDERVVALWHEQARDVANGTTGLSGWIDAAWTTTTTNDTWQRLPQDQLIGPCSAGSNGIQWEGKAYVACVVDRGYADRARARIGDVDLWEIDPATNTTRLVGHTGMTTGGDVLLAQTGGRHDTYVGLVAWDRLTSDDDGLQRLEVHAGYAWLNTLKAPGGQLSQYAVDIGIQLREWGRGGDDLPLNDAHITAFEIMDDTYQSMIVYNEWHDEPQDIPDIGPEADPLALVDNRFTDYNKYFMAFNGCDGPVAGYEAQIGTAVDNYNAEQYAANNGIFNEPRDGLFKTREKATGEELLYFALGDYGAMQYGAVVISAQSSFCNPPPLMPLAPATAAPQALTTASGVSHAMAASFAIPAAAMVGYMLTVKRRKPAYTAAED